MNSGRLIIFSGLPGSGKSTLASRLSFHLNATYLRIDTIEQGLRDICGIIEIGGQGYHLAHRIAQENLRLGRTVISDSVNPWPLTRMEWNNVAKVIGVPYLNIEITCSNKGEHQSRIESRISTVQGLKPVTWQDVVERDYRPWNEDRIQIDTGGKSIDESFAILLASV